MMSECIEWGNRYRPFCVSAHPFSDLQTTEQILTVGYCICEDSSLCSGVTQSRSKPGKLMHVQTKRRGMIKLRVISDFKTKVVWTGGYI